MVIENIHICSLYETILIAVFSVFKEKVHGSSAGRQSRFGHLNYYNLIPLCNSVFNCTYLHWALKQRDPILISL